MCQETQRVTAPPAGFPLVPHASVSVLLRLSAAMSWWRDNFWILLAAAIIVVSLVLGLILYCVYRRQFRQGNDGHLPWAGGGGAGDVSTAELGSTWACKG